MSEIKRWSRLRRNMQRVTQHLNVPLLVGGLFVLLLVVCAAAAPMLAPFDPIEPVVSFDLKAPYPPGTHGMLLGSDSLRRDLLSRIIYGSRYTLLFCGVAALLRVAIGMLLGMLAAWYQRVSWAIDILVGSWSAIPSVFFALLVLGLINRYGNLWVSTLAFVIVLSLSGWPEIAIRSRMLVQSLRSSAFIEAAHAIGLSRWMMLWHHIFPNMRDLLLVEAIYAMAAALLLVGELGFLGVFVGDAEREVVGASIASDPIYAEWGSMLAKGMRERFAGMWLFLAPVAAFTFAILAFNLLAEGLRHRR